MNLKKELPKMQKTMTVLLALFCGIIFTACTAAMKEEPRPKQVLPPPAQILVCKRPALDAPPADMPESYVALQINEIYDAWGDCYTKLSEIRQYFQNAVK
jgi:hypothetical protein